MAVHIPATGLYCLAHVLGFAVLRRLAYWAAGSSYDAPLDLGYEFPKDLRSYVSVVAMLWAGGRLALLWSRADQSRTERPGGFYDIRDGARSLRVPVGDIVAVRSAGNYVEFRLADGRAPLMRATLAAVEAQVRAHGFVRTHRSWLVNPMRVREIAPEGSGDFALALEGGLEAPLSRRFPEALAALRSEKT